MRKPLILLVSEATGQPVNDYTDNLKTHYDLSDIMPAKKAWPKILKEHPDMVIYNHHAHATDCIDTCRKIKTDKRTKHIPVIVTGPFISDEHYISCLGIGVADYIVSPVNFEILHYRVRNILAQQSVLKKTLVKQVAVKYSEIAIESPDEKFIQQALQIVEKNIVNPAFSVSGFSRELHMSRVAVYKKIFALTGKAPIDFIRSIRMQRAVQLLEKSNLTISEIAYEVGFNNPKYFSRFFKKEFTMPPSAFPRKKMEQIVEQAPALMQA
jgi:AraC-like DNA-binding protein